MRIAVVGAAGRTGRHIVHQALERGEEVIAVARAPHTLDLDGERLVRARADVRDKDELRAALEGADAVVSALGTGRSRAPTDVLSHGVSNELEVMRERGIRQLAVISAAPAGPREEQAFLERRIAMPILELFFGPLYADMRRMETSLRESEASWVALRPPRLVDRPARGRYRLDAKPLPRGRAITYADLATALLDSLARPELQGQALYVAN